MKKYFITLSALTLMAVAVSAQSSGDSTKNLSSQQNSWKMHDHKEGFGMKNHRDHFMMMKDLNLSDAQKQQAKAINEDYTNKVKDLEKDQNITLKDYRTQKAKLEQEKKSKFQDILTSEQKNKIAENKKKWSEKRELMAQKRMEKMKANLNLTDEQVAKIQEQRKSSLDQIKAIRENPSLSEEQKKAQIMDLRKTSHENINKILTTEQLKKREEMRNSRMKDMKNKWENKAS